MTSNLMKMILILLFMSDCWLGKVNLKNTKHLKSISAELMPIVWHCRIVVCQKMIKTKQNHVSLSKTSVLYFNIEVLEHFITEHYTQGFDIVQKSF